MFSRLKDLVLDFAPTVFGRFSNRLQMQRGGLKVGWFLVTTDLHSASTRYRCFHFARVFQNLGIQNSYFTNPDALCAQMETLDVIIIVKRLDTGVIDVVAEAKRWNKAVFLDLCDHLVAAGYSKNRPGANALVFTGVVSDLDGIVVPSPVMASRMEEHCTRIGHGATPICVIPDVAETETLFQHVAMFRNRSVSLNRGAGFASPMAKRKVVWFGQFGAPHSNFGIASLLFAIPSLRAVNQDIPLELIVVSNSKEIYRALIADCGVPTRYVSWSPGGLYAELRDADLVLLTTGNDEFSAVKSSNRILLALAMGVPVVALSNSALAEFEDCISLNNIERGLRNYLGDDRARWVSKALLAAQPVLSSYHPEKLAAIWLELIQQAIEEKRGKVHLRSSRDRLLVILDSELENQSLGEFFSHCKGSGYEFRTVAAAETCRCRPILRDTLINHHIAPVVFTSPASVHDAMLDRSDVLVLEEKPGKLGTLLREMAKKMGVPVTSVSEIQRGFISGRQLTDESLSDRVFESKPGPFPETNDPAALPTWLFVVHENNKGWILDGICREIGSRQPAAWKVAYNPPKLPPARNYFFSHYSLYLKHYKSNAPALKNSGTFVWYTHPPQSELFENSGKIVRAFNAATRVIFTCNAHRELWIGRGLLPEKGQVVLGAADPNAFLAHRRGGGCIGLSSSFYERKNPDCLLNLVRLMPHRQFRLVGRNWEQYAFFESLRVAPNFKYVTVPYNRYPAEYEQFDVFLSVSKREGGPIPLIETMMCNIVPVASRTGFAPDLIRHGENGFLFDTEAPAEEIISLIEDAYSLDADIRATVVDYSWDNFSREIASLGK